MNLRFALGEMVVWSSCYGGIVGVVDEIRIHESGVSYNLLVLGDMLGFESYTGFIPDGEELSTPDEYIAAVKADTEWLNKAREYVANKEYR